MLLEAICACVLLGILVAGLWPFHAPRNEVSWLSQGNGLLFGKHGSIVSANAFDMRSRADSSCSLEIWVEPSRVKSSGTILAFYWPTSRVVPFALRQSLGDLKLERRSYDKSAKKARLYVDDVFSRLKPVFFTISSGETGTAIYVDGILVKKSANFRLSSQDLTGQLVIGNAPATTDSWSGQVKGLALYDRELPAVEVLQHFADWTGGSATSKQPDLVRSERVVASYLFNEGKANVAHNQVDSGPKLLIPERFFVLRKQFLERPWDEFRSDWSYWKDVGINIAGFLPLGFFFSAYFSAIGKIKRATWLTIALGFAVSLTIEVLQAFLPSRDSGMTDLITNTFGTALGAILCAWSVKHNWFARAGVASVVCIRKRKDVQFVEWLTGAGSSASVGLLCLPDAQGVLPESDR
jgi:VanZ like family/Concanavalin A-like lectin/glucanases superfamily